MRIPRWCVLVLGLTAPASLGAMAGSTSKEGAPTLPDLVPLDLSATICPGGRFVALSYRLANKGTGPAPATLANWGLRFPDQERECENEFRPVLAGLRPRPDFMPGTPVIEGLIHDALPPGEAETTPQVLYWPIPGHARGQRIEVSLTVDGTANVLESGDPEAPETGNGTNNFASAVLAIPGERSGIDPTIQELRVVHRKGRLMRLEAKVINEGAGRTGPLTYTWSANGRIHGPLEEPRLTGLVTGVTESLVFDHGITAEDVSRGVIQFTFTLDAPDDRDFSNNVVVLEVPVGR